MRHRDVFGSIVLVAFGVLVSHGNAAAQAQGQAAPQPPDAVAGITRQVDLTPQEQVAQAEGHVGRMTGARETMRQALEKARLQRDVVKTLCLNDKLNQTDVAIRGARERREAVASAAQRADREQTSHELMILGVLRQRVDQLSVEANQCIGQGEAFVEDSAVTFTVDPGIAPDTSGLRDQFGDIAVPVPSCVSCFR